DRRRFEQVVANLVENAFEHGAPPVVVTATASDGEVVVHVTDHGPGVDPLAEPALFSRLTLTGLPRRRSPSTGLGLALVRGLVEAMGGRVWYESPPEGGARFSFTLPAAWLPVRTGHRAASRYGPIHGRAGPVGARCPQDLPDRGARGAGPARRRRRARAG